MVIKMLAQSSIIAFIATTRPQQAKAFYSEVLGLQLKEDSPFVLVYAANGTMLRIQKVEKLPVTGYTALGWKVSDIQETVEWLQNRGIRFNHYPGLQQDEIGIWVAPGGDKVAWFNDPDGNILSLIEFRSD